MGTPLHPKFTADALKRVDVTIANLQTGELTCDECSARWSSGAHQGAELPARYWACPKGCNTVGRSTGR